MTAIEESILALDTVLEGAPFEFVYLGGSVLSLLVTDPQADSVRVTKDIDLMLGARTRMEYHHAESYLEEKGFRHDTDSGAPLCRWLFEATKFDLLPIRENVLGWRSRWFESAFAHAERIVLAGRTIRIVSAPYFVALKLEAFEERGAGDFLTSTDFEDVVCLFNGRPSIVGEIASEPELRTDFGPRFGRYLNHPDLIPSVEGFVQTETDPGSRAAAILSRFREIAAFSDECGKRGNAG